jgi:lipopolysaccharide transport system ATP-binding protein
MSSIISCSGVWKRYGKPARGIKDILVGRNRKLESKYAREWALKDISFEVARGQAFGIVGHNGTGKSTLLSLLMGAIQPAQGEICVNGRTAALLELGAGFHPELTGRENIFLYGAILGMTLAEIRKSFDAIVAFSELETAIDTPIRTYSNGMLARLGFSTIIHAPADILLVDEVLAVGDSRFNEKCRDFLHDFKARQGTLVIVSHDLTALEQMCDVGMCLDLGQVVSIGKMGAVLDDYKQLMGLSAAPPE